MRVLCDEKDTILGTVVDPNGYILTKWSELKGNLIVRTSDSNEYDATLVAAHRGTDLALLKVDAKNLKAGDPELQKAVHPEFRDGYEV